MPAGELGGDVLGGAGAGAALGPYGAAGGALLGLGKYFFLDKPKYQRQVALAAATQRYSPWTHLTAQTPDAPDPVSNVMAFGSTGASIGQGINASQKQDMLQEAMAKKLNAEAMSASSRAPAYNYGTSAPMGHPSYFGSDVMTPDQLQWQMGY